MLDRKDIKEGGKYMLDGLPVIVYMIHKPCSGESVSLRDPMPDGCTNYFPYIRKKTMQMRKFQKAATKFYEEK